MAFDMSSPFSSACLTWLWKNCEKYEGATPVSGLSISSGAEGQLANRRPRQRVLTSSICLRPSLKQRQEKRKSLTDHRMR